METSLSIVAVPFLIVIFVGTSCTADVQSKHQEFLERQEEANVKQHELSQPRSEESADDIQASNELMQKVSRVSKIIGTHVKNPKGDDLGDINELVLNSESGQVVYAVVSFGGVGVGDKFFAIPWKALRWPRDKAYCLLDMNKATLETSPGFDKKHWPDSSNQLDLQSEGLNQFYHIKP